MSKVTGWWASWGFGKERHRPETDFADMGTAFGLDASFGRDGAAGASTVPGRPLESLEGGALLPKEDPARP